MGVAEPEQPLELSLSSVLPSLLHIMWRWGNVFLISWKSTWSQSQHVHTVFGRLRMPLRTADFQWWQVSAFSSDAYCGSSGHGCAPSSPLLWRRPLLHLVAGEGGRPLSCPSWVLCFNAYLFCQWCMLRHFSDSVNICVSLCESPPILNNIWAGVQEGGISVKNSCFVTLLFY